MFDLCPIETGDPCEVVVIHLLEGHVVRPVERREHAGLRWDKVESHGDRARRHGDVAASPLQTRCDLARRRSRFGFGKGGEVDAERAVESVDGRQVGDDADRLDGLSLTGSVTGRKDMGCANAPRFGHQADREVGQ